MLEAGRFDGPLTRAIATVADPWLARSLVRPVSVPSGTPLVCVGGATLGGSGKSRLANALVQVLGEMGHEAVLVGHGYRAGDRRARFVSPNETVASAGDEALVAARRGLRVVIGPSRQEAIDFAVGSVGSPLLVLDGPLAVTHRRSVSVLAVDAEAPWGSGEVIPAGDLRASRSALEAMADFVAPVSGEVDVPLPPRPFGLFTALARPDRLMRALCPDVVVSAPDHGPVTARWRRRLRTHEVTTWVATEKCALHLEDSSAVSHNGVPLQVRTLPDTYMARLDRAFVRRILSELDL